METPKRIILDVMEMAEFLNVSETTVRRRVKNEKIPYHRAGNRILFTSYDLELFLGSSAIPMVEAKFKDRWNTQSQMS